LSFEKPEAKENGITKPKTKEMARGELQGGREQIKEQCEIGKCILEKEDVATAGLLK